VAVDREELRTGLRETRRYLLSHHEPAEHYRCYRVGVRGREVRLCARCSGVYPGIGLGLATFLLTAFDPLHLALVVGLPVPALVDWAATSFGDRRGANPVRTATGGLLGYGYGLGLGYLFGAGEVWLLGVGVGYALVAGVLSYWYHARNG